MKILSETRDLALPNGQIIGGVFDFEPFDKGQISTFIDQYGEEVVGGPRVTLLTDKMKRRGALLLQALKLTIALIRV